MSDIFDRLGKRVHLKNLSQMVCIEYKIGMYQGHKIMHVGMDDFSYAMTTSKGKYLIKLFHHEKTIVDMNRYSEQYRVFMKCLTKKQIPYLLATKTGVIRTFKIDGTIISLCVIEYFRGKDFYTIGRLVTKEEIDKLLQIIIPIHKTSARLEIVYDSTSFPCLEKKFQYYKDDLPEKMMVQGQNIIKEMKKIPIDLFPKTYIHGDLSKTNIMYHKEDGIKLIDFNSSGYGYRIVDIVKIMNAFIFDYQWSKQSIELWTYFIEKYQYYLPLTENEIKYLTVVQEADAYIGMMVEYHTRYVQLDNDKENEYWYKNDRTILQELNGKE